MPFYSRHSSDGRERLLGDIHDEEEYDQFMKVIFISSNFTDEIQSHYDSSDADVLPPSSTEEKRLKRQRNTKENTIVNTIKRSNSNHTCVEFVEKLFPTALISKDTKSLKDVQKQRTMFSEINLIV